MTTAKKARVTTAEKRTAMALEGMARDIDERALKLSPSAEARERQRRLVMAVLDYIDQHRPLAELRGEWVASKLKMKPSSVNYEWRMRGMALPATKTMMKLLRLCIEEVGRSWLKPSVPFKE